MRGRQPFLVNTALPKAQRKPISLPKETSPLATEQSRQPSTSWRRWTQGRQGGLLQERTKVVVSRMNKSVSREVVLKMATVASMGNLGGQDPSEGSCHRASPHLALWAWAGLP